MLVLDAIKHRNSKWCDGLGFRKLTFLDGRISARLAPDHLRRLAVGAEKGTSHSVAILESGQLRDNVKGVVGVFHQRALTLGGGSRQPSPVSGWFRPGRRG